MEWSDSLKDASLGFVENPLLGIECIRHRATRRCEMSRDLIMLDSMIEEEFGNETVEVQRLISVSWVECLDHRLGHY